MQREDLRFLQREEPWMQRGHPAASFQGRQSEMSRGPPSPSGPLSPRERVLQRQNPHMQREAPPASGSSHNSPREEQRWGQRSQRDDRSMQREDLAISSQAP